MYNVASFGAKPKIDQFTASEFFKSKSKMLLTDYNVFANSANDPELQAKIREHMIETEVSGYDDSVSNEQILCDMISKYESADTLIERVISRVRSLPEEQPSES